MLGFLGAMLCSGGCRRASSAERPLLDLVVRDQTGEISDPALKLDPAKVRADAIAEIERIGFQLRAPKDDEIGWQAELVLELTAERNARPDDAGVLGKDQAFRAVMVSIRIGALKVDPKTRVRPEYRAQALVGRNVGVFDGVAGLEHEAVADAIHLLNADLELANGTDDQVLKRIEDPDPRIRLRGIGAARDRKLKEAMPRLIKMLDDDTAPAEVVMEVIGALIAIGDPRGVPPLIEAGRRRSPVFLGQILFGLAQIGGREAEAYLFTVSSGHPDPEVRKSADEALRELEQHREHGRAKEKGD